MTDDLFNYVKDRAEKQRKEARSFARELGLSDQNADYAASDVYQAFLAGASAVLEFYHDRPPIKTI